MLTDAATLTQAARDLIGTPGSCIGGTWVTDGDGEVEVVDPATEEVIARVPTVGPARVEEAVRAARKAFDEGPWPTMHPRERQAAINRFTDCLERHQAALVDLGVVEIGSPVTLSRGLHAAAPLAFFRWWADMALRGPHGSYQHGLGLHEGPPVLSNSILFHEPVGVVAGVIAYNYPMMLKAFKVGGAMAAGCTTVMMPSPRTPLASVAFMRIAEEAELPSAVLNLVIGGADAGKALTESQGVDLVSFTGSVKVGRQVMTQAAQGLKRVVLELGGKSPNILLPGCDLEAAILPSLLRFTRASGQGCGCTTRILVPRGDMDSFLELARTKMDALVVGDPWDDRTDVGPLIRAEHKASVDAYVERAVASGAEIVAGGKPHGMAKGYYTSPALVGSVANDAEICQEELFGPIGVVLPYDTVDEAVAIANDTRYGLNASVWGPLGDAMRVARRIRSGTVAINGGGGERPDAPWSGYGESSVGAERGEAGFAEFFQVKHVQFPL
jgi:aldehyde dehydrogenase (NAD+)/betaine-aldehyde dehydrogenase